MQRILEPEVMDSWQEAVEYDAMDFSTVNLDFVERALFLAESSEPSLTPRKMLDAGTGTARIPILICQNSSGWQVEGIDLAESMLQIGQQNILQAGLQSQISVALQDAKALPYPDHDFDMVISNSLVHHLPDPLPFFQEVRRILKPGGALLIRDLLRPLDDSTVQRMVAEIGPEYSDRQQQLFADSLRAALTLEEVEQLVQSAQLHNVRVYQSSDRHWSLERPWQAQPSCGEKAEGERQRAEGQGEVPHRVKLRLFNPNSFVKPSWLQSSIQVESTENLSVSDLDHQ